MGDQGSDRERVLEERLARLEARLQRLEAAAMLAGGAAQPAPATAVPPIVAQPSPTVASQAVPPQQPFVWRAPEPSAQRPRPAGSGWVAPGSKPIPPTPSTGQSSRGTPFGSMGRAGFTASLAEIEARLAGRALAWAGGIALILGAIFFLSIAFSRGWIGPELRVVIGLVAGSVALAIGAVLLERGNRLLGHVLTPVGLAVISISLVGATRLYDLIPVEIGLIVALISAIAAAVIAVRADSQIVAAFGLISVLAAPPLLGATPDLATLLFVVVVLIGTTGVALWRSWSWLPPTAFVLSVPQVATWVGSDPATGFGLVGIWLYWLLNVVAAGGEEFRRRRDNLSPSSATLLLANVAFLVWAGFELLSDDRLAYRAFFLVLVALAQAGIGGYFVVRDGERNLFGLLAIATGIAAVTMAVPIGLGAPAVPIAWTAEAVALAWVAVRRGHPYSAFASAILYALAGVFVISLYRDPPGSTSGVPFVDGPGAALGFFLAGVAVGVWLVRDRSLRAGLAALGLLVAATCVTSVLDTPGTVIAWSILMVVGAAVRRVIPLLPGAAIVWLVQGLIPRVLQGVGDWRRPTDALLPFMTTFLGVAATVALVGPVYGRTTGDPATGVPFVDPAGAALAAYLVGLLIVGWVDGRSRLREPLAAVGLVVTAWACVTEFDGVALVAAWSALMVMGFALWRLFRSMPQGPRLVIFEIARPRLTMTLDLVLPFTAVFCGLLATLHILATELPSRQFGRELPPKVPFTDSGAVAAMFLTAAILLSGAAVGGARARRASILLAGGVVAYTIPFEVYAWVVAILWVGLAGLALVMARVDRPGRSAFLIACAILVGCAATVAILIVAPPSQLQVTPAGLESIAVLQSIAALGAVVIGLLMLARFGKTEPWVRWTRLAAGVTVVYLISVAVVGVFASRVGGSTSTDELRTQGQVALSVSWAIMGVVAFVAGLRLQMEDLRRGGMALLGLATAKVFLFDLAALDVAYRVISLIVLGVLLLVSAGLWQRFQPRPPEPERPAEQELTPEPERTVEPGVADMAPETEAAPEPQPPKRPPRRRTA